MEDAVDILRQSTASCSIRLTEKLPDVDIGVDPFLIFPNKKFIVGKSSVRINGNKRVVRRVFVEIRDAVDYRAVGWVVDEDVENCMICSVGFTILQRKHHCRICGNIICVGCSNWQVLISEYPMYGFVRACDCCCFGQVLIQVLLNNNAIIAYANFAGRNINCTTSATHNPTYNPQTTHF